MKNLFKDAKLGDKFQRRVPPDKYFVFVRIYDNMGNKMARLINENKILSVNLDGTHPIDHNLDVVGRWQEPIDDDKLERMAAVSTFSKKTNL